MLSDVPSCTFGVVDETVAHGATRVAPPDSRPRRLNTRPAAVGMGHGRDQVIHSLAADPGTQSRLGVMMWRKRPRQVR
jgi:hypothetical protein